MKHFLEGRRETARFKVPLPASRVLPKDNMRQKQEEETVVRADRMPDLAPEAPEVDLVVRNGQVRQIIVHLPDGQRLELDCEYDSE